MLSTSTRLPMTDQAQSSEHELRLNLYGETRADLLKRQLSNSENTDRAILSVSTAALGFSPAFLKDIVSLQDAAFPLLPYLSWVLFMLAIAVTLLSFFTSQKAIDEQLVLAHKYYIDRDDASELLRPKYASVTDLLNKSGAVFLVIGLFATCMFVGINLWKGKIVSEKKQINEGATVPLMQRVPQGGELLQKGATIPIFQTVPTNPQSGDPVPSFQKVPLPPSPAPATADNSKGK